MTEARGSERSDLDTGEVGDRRSNAPVDVAMEMMTVATPTHAETTGATMFEPMERNENGMRRRRSEAPATPRDWRSRMEGTMRQRAEELTQLHQTVGHLTSLVQAEAACEEAQWLGMRPWMQEREQKWDASHEDDKMWGAGITNMIANIIQGVPPGQEARKKDKGETARMDGGELYASQHAYTPQVGGPAKCQQLQQQLKPRLSVKVQQKP